MNSILQQSIDDFELIVIDDGSTDATAAIVRRTADSRVTLIQTDHLGVVAAANRGTQESRAPLIARMDADDIALPTRLEQQCRLLKRESLDAVGSQVKIVDQVGETPAAMRRYERWINKETLCGDQISALRFVEFPLVNPTILARRAYFELGFRDDDLPEDYDLMLRAAAAGARFGKVADVLLRWSDGPQRLTRNDARYSSQAFARCRKTHLRSGPLREVGSVDLWGFGQTGKPWLRWLHSQEIAVRRGYDISERKLGMRIHGVVVQHPRTMPATDGTPLLVAVGAAGARDVIRPHITSLGYVPGVDAWFVA